MIVKFSKADDPSESGEETKSATTEYSMQVNGSIINNTQWEEARKIQLPKLSLHHLAKTVHNKRRRYLCGLSVY